MAVSSFQRWVMDSDVKSVSSNAYRNETAKLQKQLEDIKLQKSVFRQHLSGRYMSAVSICSLNNTSLWSPMSDTSAQLSDSQYSMSTCTESPNRPHTGSLCHCDNQLDSSQDSACEQDEEDVEVPSSPQRECLRKCVRQLMFGDVTDIMDVDLSTRSNDSSFSLDSGYTSLPDPDCIATSNKLSCTSTTLDSDATVFIEAPLRVHRPVTHKTGGNHRTIAKQLKRVGKHIHKHGIDSCMSTLAVL